MDDSLNKLVQELKSGGATDKEAEVLSMLAKNLSNSVNLRRSESVKLNFLKRLNLYPRKVEFFRRYAFAPILALALFFAATTVSWAQSSLPGQPLYPIKRLSEKIAVVINPSVKDDILTRRSQEIKSITGKKSSSQFRTAVSDYESQLSTTNKISTEQIDENKKNLEEAARNSSEEEQHVLEDVIKQTEEKQKELESREDVRGINSFQQDQEHNDRDSDNILRD